jgi:hypothetical protein
VQSILLRVDSQFSAYRFNAGAGFAGASNGRTRQDSSLGFFGSGDNIGASFDSTATHTTEIVPGGASTMGLGSGTSRPGIATSF